VVIVTLVWANEAAEVAIRAEARRCLNMFMALCTV